MSQNYKTKLLVSINDGDYYEVLKSMDNKVNITFEPSADSNDYSLKITLADGTSVAFKCVPYEQPVVNY